MCLQWAASTHQSSIKKTPTVAELLLLLKLVVRSALNGKGSQVWNSMRNKFALTLS